MRFFGKLLVSVALLVTLSTLAIAAYPDVKVLLNAVTANGSGKAHQFDKGSVYRVAQAVFGGGASAVSATVALDGSLDGANWTTIGSVNLASSPAASQVASITSSFPWTAMRGTVSAISGAGATVTLNVAY